jgi:hypothetical protein
LAEKIEDRLWLRLDFARNRQCRTSRPTAFTIPRQGRRVILMYRRIDQVNAGHVRDSSTTDLHDSTPVGYLADWLSQTSEVSPSLSLFIYLFIFSFRSTFAALFSILRV